MSILKYFLSCYFNESADYSELTQLIQSFLEIEKKEYVDQLINEVSNVSVEEFQLLTRKYGGRKLSVKKANEILMIIKGDI